MPAARTTEALIRNALVACERAGVEWGAIEVAEGGVIRILPPGAIPAQSAPKGENTCDGLFPEESD